MLVISNLNNRTSMSKLIFILGYLQKPFNRLFYFQNIYLLLITITKNIDHILSTYCQYKIYIIIKY
jgi:hypothetical protein